MNLQIRSILSTMSIILKNWPVDVQFIGYVNNNNCDMKILKNQILKIFNKTNLVLSNHLIVLTFAKN